MKRDQLVNENGPYSIIDWMDMRVRRSRVEPVPKCSEMEDLLDYKKVILDNIKDEVAHIRADLRNSYPLVVDDTDPATSWIRSEQYRLHLRLKEDGFLTKEVERLEHVDSLIRKVWDQVLELLIESGRG